MTEKSMKPLVYYCRWHSARLMLHGRDDRFIWGDLLLLDEDGRLAPFRYDMQTWELTRDEGKSEIHVRLDEMGVTIDPDSDGSISRSSSDAEP